MIAYIFFNTLAPKIIFRYMSNIIFRIAHKIFAYFIKNKMVGFVAIKRIFVFTIVTN